MAIRQIRHRREMTTTEFGVVLGVSHATVSRYESGRMKPGRAQLGKLLLLAEGTEKNPIISRLNSVLGVTGGEREILIELSLLNRLKEFADQDLRAAMGPKGLKELDRFLKLAFAIGSLGQEVDPALNRIVELWITADTINPETRRAFEQAANFLGVALSFPGRAPEEPGEA
jgi:transcriptional regulator with XRE-family HTH domain